jgi:hypothetical protein
VGEGKIVDVCVGEGIIVGVSVGGVSTVEIMLESGVAVWVVEGPTVGAIVERGVGVRVGGAKGSS